MGRTSEVLTQKEAIFLIISTSLGERFKEGTDARTLLYGPNRKHYGRRVYDSKDLDQIRAKITDGLRNGKVPSTKKQVWAREGSKEVGTYSGTRIHDPVEEYANKIMHYWLRRDTRLNGGHSPGKVWYKNYLKLKRNDKRLKSIQGLLELKSHTNDAILIQAHIKIRELELLLTAHGVELEKLPTEVFTIFGKGKKAV